jgi:hypothetical protein
MEETLQGGIMNIEGIKTKIKQEWEERPIIVIAVVATVSELTFKTIKAVNESRNSKSWEKEVDRRNKMYR